MKATDLLEIEKELDSNNQLGAEHEDEGEEPEELEKAFSFQERIVLENKSQGVLVQLESKLIRADALLDMALDAYDEILIKKNGKRGVPLGVG